MTLTRRDDNDAIIQGRALGWHHDYFTGPQNALYLDMSFVSGPGHLLSTVQDLHRFALVLEEPSVLHPHFRDNFFRERGWTVQRTPVMRATDTV